MMTKFGVRLLALFFIFWALSEIYGLVTSLRTHHGFMGIYISLSGASNFDLMGWIGGWILLSVGYQLWVFENGGRIWAPIIFWPRVLAFLYYFIVLKPAWLGHAENWSGTLSITGWSTTIRSPFGLFFIIGVMVFDIGVIYFLMRKKTKELFQNLLASEANPNPIIAQDSTHAQ